MPWRLRNRKEKAPVPTQSLLSMWGKWDILNGPGLPSLLTPLPACVDGPSGCRSLRAPRRASRKLVCFPDGKTSPPHRPLLGGELASQAPDLPTFKTLDNPTSQRLNFFFPWHMVC